MPALSENEKGFQIECGECGAMETWWVVLWWYLQSGGEDCKRTNFMHHMRGQTGERRQIPRLRTGQRKERPNSVESLRLIPSSLITTTNGVRMHTVAVGRTLASLRGTETSMSGVR